MANAKSAASAARMRRSRERKAAGIVLIQDLQLTRSGVEGLIAKGLLDEEAGSDPALVSGAFGEAPKPNALPAADTAVPASAEVF